MIKKFIYILSFVFGMIIFLTGCEVGPVGEPQLESVTPTKTISPTNTIAPTITPVPFSEINLESILVRDGDLPAGYRGAQIRSQAPAMFDDLPEPQNEVFQQFEHDGEAAGGVSIFLFENETDLENSFDIIYDGMSDDASLHSRVGEKSAILEYSRNFPELKFKFEVTEFLFIRCGALVHIRMTDVANIDYAEAFAERLDKRLEDLICR